MVDSLLVPLLNPVHLTGIITILAVLLVMILLMYLISAFVGKPFNLSLGPLKINFSSRNKTNQKDEKTNDTPDEHEHESETGNITRCSNCKFIIEQVKSIVCDKVKEKIELQYEILRRQLEYTEEKCSDIKSIMSNTYTDLLKTKIPEEDQPNIKSHREYKIYQMILKIGLNQCIVNTLKRAFKRNHLDEMDQEEWKKYIKHKNDIMVQRLSEFLDIMYDDSFLVTREELSIGNDVHLKNLKIQLTDIIETAKEIYLKNKSKMDMVDHEIDTKIDKLFLIGDEEDK
jgi:Na+-transporting methylmalonyl-CoA/oxaloacetate decarboxylase gamma subunit